MALSALVMLMLIKDVVAGNAWDWLEHNGLIDSLSILVMQCFQNYYIRPDYRLLNQHIKFLCEYQLQDLLGRLCSVCSTGNHYCLLCNHTLHKFGTARKWNIRWSIKTNSNLLILIHYSHWNWYRQSANSEAFAEAFAEAELCFSLVASAKNLPG